MITEAKTHLCRKCGSEQLVRNGKTAAGKQKFLCRACGAAGTLELTPRYSEQEKATILAAYQERASLRGIKRVFGVTPETVLSWLKKSPAPPAARRAAAAGEGERRRRAR
jgi:transposase-like protein